MMGHIIRVQLNVSVSRKDAVNWILLYISNPGGSPETQEDLIRFVIEYISSKINISHKVYSQTKRNQAKGVLNRLEGYAR